MKLLVSKTLLLLLILMNINCQNVEIQTEQNHPDIQQILKPIEDIDKS